MKTISSTIYAAFALLLASFALLAQMEAVVPPPDGGYPNFTTAEGEHALQALTAGVGNTAIGTFSLFSVSTGNFNTAIGAGSLDLNLGDFNTATGAAALLFNTTGTQNTANGTAALEFNTTGAGNTANGAFTLFSNTTGNENTAIGFEALFGSTTSRFNTAVGVGALASTTTGNSNTAIGDAALNSNSTGYFNTATGYAALSSNNAGHNNTAVGIQALTSTTTGNANAAIGDGALIFNTTGSSNIALGSGAGSNLTTGDYNIDIDNTGVTGEANTIRIGDDNHHGAVYIAGVYGRAVAGLTVVMDSSDHLGTVASSRRFKDDIEPMAQASEAILALRPVTFRYKKEIDPAGASQFGLVAEEVEKVDPDLVVCDKQGKPYTVRYDQVNAMLLNEFLKEHSKVEEQDCKLQSQGATIAELKKQVAALTAGLQKVRAQLVTSSPSVADSR